MVLELWYVLDSPVKHVKTQIGGSQFLVSDSVGLGKPRICIFNRFPGHSNATNMKTVV